MFRFHSVALVIGLAAFVPNLAACSSDDTSDKGGDGKSATSGDGKGDGNSNGDDKSGDDGKTSLGPKCQAYLECCKELAAKEPSVASSCQSVEDQIENAQNSGASTETYESACESGVTSFQSAGYCK